MISISISNVSSRTLRAAALAAIAVVAGHGAAYAAPVTKWTNDGAYAAVYGSDASGCVALFLEVSRAGSKTAPQTTLYYELFDVCAGQSIGFGSGYIANTALRVRSKSVTLNVRVATTSSFYTEGPTGAIALTFTPDGVFEAASSGHVTVSFPGGTFREHGSWSDRTAAASGTVLNVTFDRSAGEIGEGRDKQMEFERTAK